MPAPFIPVSTQTLHGLGELLYKLKVLPDNLQRRALASSVRKGAAVVRSAAVANAKMLDDPKTAEQIYRNVAVQFSARQSKLEGGVVFRVGIRGGARRYTSTKENVRKGRVGQQYVTPGDRSNPGGDTYYWRFLEFGTSTIGATSFMTRALSDNTERATLVIVEDLSLQLNKLLYQLR